MNILVTGGAGFIGSNLIESLVKEDHSVTSIDNYSNGTVSNHIDGATYCNLDTADLKTLKGYDVIFHLGEYSRVVPSFIELQKVWDSNINGTFNILRLLKDTPECKLIYGASSTKFAEESIRHSPYSFTKAFSSELISSFGQWYNINYSLCFFYNVYGPRQGNCKYQSYKSVISIFEDQWRNNKPLTVTGNGQQTRSFTHVHDIVKGLTSVMSSNKCSSFYFGHPKQYSILEIANTFSDNIVFTPERLGDRRVSILPEDSIIANETIGWSASKDVKDWIQNLKHEKTTIH